MCLLSSRTGAQERTLISIHGIDSWEHLLYLEAALAGLYITHLAYSP